MDSVLTDAFNQFLSRHCAPSRVRTIEADESSAAATALWLDVVDSGFADALVAESHGGAGLDLRAAEAIAFACGRHAMPLPLSITVLVRAALLDSGVPAPEGSITVAMAARPLDGGGLFCAAVPYGFTADWVLVETATTQRLLPTSEAARDRAGGHGVLSADLCWSALPDVSAKPEYGDAHYIEWRAAAAAATASNIAGALDRLSEMTIAYANDRCQFGKPIAKLQAIQQQLSVMAEESFAARMAARIGMSGESWKVDPLRAAVAKTRAGEAAMKAGAIAHGVHGAIGATEEYDLQLLTRRLHEWRGQYGGETYWNRRLGHALLEDRSTPLRFVQDRLAPLIDVAG